MSVKIIITVDCLSVLDNVFKVRMELLSTKGVLKGVKEKIVTGDNMNRVSEAARAVAIGWLREGTFK